MQHNHFTRPIQTDRNSHTYGHTKLRFDGQPKKGTIRRALAGIFVFGVTVTAFVLFVSMLSTPRP